MKNHLKDLWTRILRSEVIFQTSHLKLVSSSLLYVQELICLQNFAGEYDVYFIDIGYRINHGGWLNFIYTGCPNKSAPWRNIIIKNISQKYCFKSTHYLVSPISSLSNAFDSIKFEHSLREIWYVIRQCAFYVLFMSCYYPPNTFLWGVNFLPDWWFHHRIKYLCT